MDLTQKKCVPCTGVGTKLEGEQVVRLLVEVPGWAAHGDRLRRSFRFKGFRAAIAFVNQMAELAEAEQHHPDFSVHYDLVEVETWTHVASGITENDFILAAKISKLVPEG